VFVYKFSTKSNGIVDTSTEKYHNQYLKHVLQVQLTILN